MNMKLSSFTCLLCGMTSHNPEDARHGYCGRCHTWVTDQVRLLEHWVVYDHPLDHPDGFIARLWLITPLEQRPTSLALIHPTLDGLRAQLPAGLSRLARDPDDDPTIVEVWV